MNYDNAHKSYLLPLLLEIYIYYSIAYKYGRKVFLDCQQISFCLKYSLTVSCLFYINLQLLLWILILCLYKVYFLKFLYFINRAVGVASINA